MNESFYKKFYNRDDIKSEIIFYSKNREIAPRFNDFFGKRPQIIENKFDYDNLVKKGVSSFHMSEEIWVNPLLLGENLPSNELDKNRDGWDLILDLDGVDFEFAKIAAKKIILFLKNLNVKNISIKFSGNKGFHIGIPFKAFSKNILGIGETKLLFPEAPRKIASFLMYELKGEISKSILEKFNYSIENIEKRYNFKRGELEIEDEDSNKLDFLKLIEIDTILIAKRHLFRMPYSINEKSGLVSIPVDINKLDEFSKEMAKPENVDPKKYEKFRFLDYNEDFGKDADILLIKSYEDNFEDKISKEVHFEIKDQNKSMFNKFQEFKILTQIDESDFPLTIKYLLENKFEDGKKRALFVLLSFLNSINYPREMIEDMIFEWNEKQFTPLRKNYIRSQLNWFLLKENKRTPPNFENEEYYKQVGIPEEIIKKDINKFGKQKSKNPLHYIYILEQKRLLKEKLNKNKKKKN
jgi:hypothetical protein